VETGLFARAYTTRNVAVSVTGNISTSSAAESIGISASATSGNVTIDIASGATVSAGGTGIVATTTGGAVTINNLGTVSAANAANFIGTMNVGNGGTTGTIIGNVLDRGTLNFNRSDAVTYGGIISDTGRVQQNGSGTLTLSGLNTYTGATNVNAGTLSVNGSIASSSLTTVNAGGTLGGNGTVGNTAINGGTLAPGNSIGTLAVQGNLVFTAAASYMVEVSPANADRTNVTGTATLGGAMVKASFAAGTYVNKQYTILNATGGISGTFNTLANTDLPANFKSSLSYDSNNAYLNLALNFIPPPGSGLNANQQSAANAIVGFFNSNGGIPLVFGGLTPAGLTQISGETATGSQQTTFNAMGLFMGLMTDPFIGGRGDPVGGGAGAPQFAEESDAANAYAATGKPRSNSERDAYAAVYRKAPIAADPFIQRWSVWAAGYGGSQTTDGNAVLGSNNTRSSIGGVAVGADYRFSPYTLAGFALAGGATNFSVNGLGSGRSDLFQAGAFVRHNVGAAYLTGALAYGWQDITTDRTVTIAGTDLLRAQFNANAFSGRAEGGYRFLTPWIGGIGLTPYAAGQFVTFDLPAYAEQAIAGANTFALSYAAKSVTDTRSELGLRSDKSYPMQNGIFTLRGRAAWAHDFNTDRAITPTLQTLPGTAFVVNGAAPAHDAALVTASAEMKWLNGISLAGTFEGEFSDVTRSYAGKGVVRYAW
jgi:autotransporter-associated beta strand protein